MNCAQLIEAVLLGAGLAMDAFGVSVTLALTQKERFDGKKMLLAASIFGAFQFFMPLFGYFCGVFCGEVLHAYGRWIAALILWLIGAKMIHDRNEKNAVSGGNGALLLLGVATSIDAFFVGIGFLCVGNERFFGYSVVIGIVTAAISLSGGFAGKKGAKKLSPARAMTLGGIMLIALGVKNLL